MYFSYFKLQQHREIKTQFNVTPAVQIIWTDSIVTTKEVQFGPTGTAYRAT